MWRNCLSSSYSGLLNIWPFFNYLRLFIYIIFDLPLGVLLTRTFNFPPFKWFYLGSQFLWYWLSPYTISNIGESALRVIERIVKVPIPVLYGVWCLHKSICKLFFLKLHVSTINNWTWDLVTPYLDWYNFLPLVSPPLSSCSLSFSNSTSFSCFFGAGQLCMNWLTMKIGQIILIVSLKLVRSTGSIRILVS